MNKIEKVKEKVVKKLKENYDSSIYEPILFFDGGDIAIELAIKLTAKEIFKEIEREHNKIKAEIKKPLKKPEDWLNKVWNRAYLSGLIFVEEKLKKSWGVKDEN